MSADGASAAVQPSIDGEEISAFVRANAQALSNLVDPDWYASQAGPLPEMMGEAADNPLLATVVHYVAVGAEQGLNPSPFFDTLHYLKSIGASIGDVPNPLAHYIVQGAGAGFSHHPLCHIHPVHTRADLGLSFLEALAEKRVAISELFRPPVAGRDAGGGDEALGRDLLSYLKGTWDSSTPPHCLFDESFYLEQVGSLPAGVTPLQHYLTVGSAMGLMPHPLFDPTYYREQMGLEPGVEPLLHYLGLGAAKEQARPHPLFDVRRYLRGVRRIGASGDVSRGADPIVDYATGPVDNRVSPHPLFDPGSYLGQFKAGETPKAPPLIDFIKGGWREGRRPHALFDPLFYHQRVGAGLGHRDPLSHYVVSPDRESPHYLFLEPFYRGVANLTDPSRPGLEHYLSEGARRRLQTHPLFQPKFYEGQCKKAGLPAAERAPDLLRHYLQEGSRVPVAPLPYFDPHFYAKKAGLEAGSTDLFEHYLAKGGFKSTSPHPAIDLQHYARVNPGFRPDVDPVIWHLLDRPKEQRKSSHPSFDAGYYLSANKDIRDHNMCPVRHFLEYGIHEGRLPQPWFSREYVRNIARGVSFTKESAVYEYFATLERPFKIAFVSHEASRTGAPAIILRLIEDFSRLKNVECLTLLDRGGERLEEFRQASHVHVLSKSVREVGEGHALHDQEIEAIVRGFALDLPDVAIVNSVESRHIAAVLDRLNIPIIWLVHEMATFYSPDVFDRIYGMSDLVVMPAQHVREIAARAVAEPPGKVVVRGQGLLTEGFGLIDRSEARRQIFRELDLPDDAFVVLGCGTLDQRKGLDYFVGAARSFLARAPADGRPAYFLWIGDGPRWVNSPFYFAQDEIVRAGLEEQVRFIGSRQDVEPYFVGADAFLMTSRADPFPCVIHEAMAARLPLIGFANAGGAPELYEQGGGETVPLGNVNDMADKLLGLYTDDAKRGAIGEKSREVVLRDWSFDGYTKFFAREIEQRLGIDLLAGQPPELGAPDMLLVKGSWSLDRHSGLISMMGQLGRDGLTSGLLFPHGRFTQHSDPLPQDEFEGVPIRYLQALSNSPEALRWQLQLQLGRMKVGVFGIESDDPAAMLSKTLRRYAPVIGFVDGKDEASVSRGYSFGRYWDLIVARSEKVAEELLELNPGFRNKIVHIPATVRVNPRSEKFIAERTAAISGPPVFVCSGVVESAVIRRRLEAAVLGLAEAIPECRIRLMLKGDEASPLANILLHRLGAGRVSETVGWQTRQLAGALRSAGGIVSVSESEQSDELIANAMGYGCIPIVVTQVSDELASMIGASAHGFYHGGGSYEEFLARLRKDLKDAGRTKEAMLAVYASAVAAERGRRRAAHKLRNRIAVLRGQPVSDETGLGAAAS
jgi:glycosyltransferase involved in cell wall biosynthesis